MCANFRNQSCNGRVDPFSAYRVCISMQSYTCKGDVEVICEGKEWDIVVDGDKFNLIVLINEIKEHYEWGTNQKASISYLDGTGQYLALTSDAALRSLVDSNFLYRQISILVSVEDIVELAKGADGNSNSNSNGNGNSNGAGDDGNGADGNGDGNGNGNGNGAGADGNSNSNGNGNDAGDDGNGDGNSANNEKEMQQRPCSKWQAMFWDEHMYAPIC